MQWSVVNTLFQGKMDPHDQRMDPGKHQKESRRTLGLEFLMDQMNDFVEFIYFVTDGFLQLTSVYCNRRCV